MTNLSKNSSKIWWRYSRPSLPGFLVCVPTRKRFAMLLCKKIKLKVTERDAATLEFMQARCRGLYNWWVMKLRDGEKWQGWRIAKKSLQASKGTILNFLGCMASFYTRSTFVWRRP